MKLNHLILFFICYVSLCISACVTPIDGGKYVDDEGTSLFIESILTHDEKPVVSVKTAESAYSGRTPEYLTDENVEVSIGISDGGSISLDYDFDNKIFTTDEFTVLQGKDYRLNVEHIDNPEIKSAYSTAIVPLKENFSKLDFVNNHNANLSIGPFHYAYDVAITLNADLQGDYYLIQPVSRAVIQDETIRNYNLEYNPYTIDRLYDPSNSVEITNDAIGLLADLEDDVDTRTLSFRISLNGNEYNFGDNRVQEHVYFYLYNITEDYYKYLKTGGGSVISSTTIVEPEVVHWNIQNGLGIFGGAAMTIDSVAIQ